MGELPLLIFTICMQAAIGIMFFVMIAKLVQKEQEFKVASVVTAGLSIAGVFASLLHLGTPLSALNSLSNLATSWLSREILLAGGFMLLAVIYAYLVYKRLGSKNLVNTLGWITSIVGVADVFMMAKSYESTSIPVWQGANTFVEFYATMFILGIAILFITSVKDLDSKTKGYFSIVVLVMVAVQIAFAVPHYIQLGLMGGAGAISAGILLADMNMLVVAQWLLLVLGSGFLLFSKSSEGNSSFTSYYVTATALSLGLIVGRYLFYAIEVATRVGLT